MSDQADHALWRFSLRVYRAEGVEAACLRLQDDHGADVNLVLFCCWLGAAGCGRVAEPLLRSALAAASQWHGRAVAPLRALRRSLKHDPAPLPAAAAEPVRRKVLAAELEAEHALQTLLFALASDLDRTALPAERRAADADANIEACLSMKGIAIDGAVRRDIATIVAAAAADA